MKISVIIPVYNQADLILRAIRSIPARNDIEIIVVDDCSTDDTLGIVRCYQMYSDQNIVTLTNEKNMGVGYSVNRGLDVATGEYIILLGSDDYLVDFNDVFQYLDGTDLVYFDLEVNSGEIWVLNRSTKDGLCGSTKLMRREFIGSTRNPNKRAGEDLDFYQELLKKHPTEKFTNRVFKHYNYPREDSLTQQRLRGEI